MMDTKIYGGQTAVTAVGTAAASAKKGSGGGFGKMLEELRDKERQVSVNFSKHAMVRAEERGIELMPDLMDKLAGSIERAQEKGATNILAFDATQAFILNVPYGRVITAMSQDEMKENIFTNIDGAVLL